MHLNFDSLPANTNVETLYQEVHFSSPGRSVGVWTFLNDFKSPPNSITRYILSSPDHLADFFADFTQPVNNLSFYITGLNAFVGPIAKVDYFYQNGTLNQKNLQISGNGSVQPMLIQVPFANVTRVRVHSVVDAFGIGFDDFDFVVPAASPTPTVSPSPSPTPPSVPGNLKAFPDEQAIDLQWTASPGATSYAVQRWADGSATAGSGNNQLSMVGDQSIPGFVTIGSVPAGTTTYHDNDPELSTEVLYTYVVSAMGPGGISAASNEASAKPIAKPGCDWQADKQKYTTKPPAVGEIVPLSTHLGWKVSYKLTADDGLVVTDVYLNGRRMADSFSVPYYKITTSGAPNQPERGELMPNGSSRPDGKLFSRLLGVKVSELPRELKIEAEYGIDNIPGAPKSCLKISQVYEFFEMGFGMPDEHHLQGPCEPSKSITTCTKFRPSVSYQFQPGPGESLSSLNIPQRLQFQVKEITQNKTPNTVHFTRDRDGFQAGQLLANTTPFIKERIPVVVEEFFRIVKEGLGNKDFNSVDNFHQTNNLNFVAPYLVPGTDPRNPKVMPGCPECVHMHWRWSWKVDEEPFRPPSGRGQPLVPPNSPQSLDAAIVAYRQGEEDPQDFGQLLNQEKLAKEGAGRYRKDTVLWVSYHSFINQDTFFWNPAWFNMWENAGPQQQIEEFNSSGSSVDGPTEITFADVFSSGTTSFEPFSLSTLPSLPAGYAALGNTAYRVDTTAIATGLHTIKFETNSVSDSTVFSKLRLFHLDFDPFDPDHLIWVDKTVLSPDSPAPDFSSKTLNAQSESLGVFVIGNLVQTITPDNSVADLSVTTLDSLDPIMAGNTLTYTSTIRNNGPQAASNVVFMNDVSSFVDLVSFQSSQGTTKVSGGKIYGSLGSLANGATATVTLVVKPHEGFGGAYPVEGKSIFDTMTVEAKQIDNNLDNNQVSESTLVLPGTNKPPTVSITAPADGILVSAPAQVTINAVATDPDGTISRVRISDNNELAGDATNNGNSQFVFTHNNVPAGTHTYVAVAEDNLGRLNISEPLTVFVNGPASVNLTSPAAGLSISPGAFIQLAAQATHPSGSIAEVEFVANGRHLGHGVAGSGGSYTFTWENVESNIYTIAAIATDNAGIQSRSASRTITVNAAPTVSIVTPSEGQRFSSNPTIGLTVAADDSDGQVAKVQFYANGTLIGAAADIVTSRFNFTWRNVPDGQYSVTAVATDNLGITSTSQPVNIGVNTAPSRPGEVIWFDDDLPAGAVKHASGDVDWYSVDSNPAPVSGIVAHQSRNFSQVSAPATTVHSHYFDGATAKLHVFGVDMLFTYVFLDPNNLPREIMLEWKDATGWEHRAYWGANVINRGVNGTASRFYMGALPQAGEWVRLEVPALSLGLNNIDLDGMSFVADGGRATWDVAGKTTTLYVPQISIPRAKDSDWVKGALPSGAITTVTNDIWNWVTCSNTFLCHQSVLPDSGVGKIRHHSFTGASPLLINPGDQLFTYVFLDPSNKPDQLFIQWHDGTNWRRAFWGSNYIELGVTGTEGWRYMGGLPETGKWVRLEIPASYLGLEGRSVTGMAFGFYKQTDNAQILWGRSGKTEIPGPVPVTLSATIGVSQFFHKDFGYYYSLKDIALNDVDRRDGVKFYVHPNQAAGTVPFYRFKNAANPQKREFFYSRCKTCVDPNIWKLDDIPIAFHVFPDNSTVGTVPLHLYHDNSSHYFLTINQSDGAGMTYDGISAYVYQSNPIVPARPSFLTWDVNSCRITWSDNSSNETGFRIEKTIKYNPWVTLATAPPNTTSFPVDCNFNAERPGVRFKVFAVNSAGDSVAANFWDSDLLWGDFQDNERTPADPIVNIVGPREAAIVSKDLVIAADGFDMNGNGSVAKVEFYDGLKLGETTVPPYNFVWKNAPNGPHTLTAVVTDATGRATTSAAVHVTVSAAPSVALTSPASGATVTAPGSVTLQANASDSDGSVARVEFFNGNAKLGEDLAAPYAFVWNNISAGSYVVTARVTDNVGLISDSAPVALIVNNAPTVDLTSPTNNELVAAPGTAFLVANVSDTDSTITKVDFYQGSTLIGTSTTFPYTYNWTNIPYGTYTITARVTDGHSAVTTSSPVTFIVNSAPNVNITSPANQAMLTPFSNAVINASASDPDGTIAKVDFYQGSTLVGTDTTAPYSITLNNLAPGAYVLSAQATDNRAAISNSPTLAITTPSFFDDFNDNSLNTTKWSLLTPQSPAVVSEQGQLLRITLPASTMTYNGIVSNASFDIRGGAVQVEQMQAVSQAGWVEDHLVIEKDANNYLMLHTGAGSTVLRSMVNGVNDQLIIPYDPVAHHYWRLRHELTSNSVNFETSPDAITWTTRKTSAAGFSLTAVKFKLIAGAFGTGNANPGAAIYNDFQFIASATPPPPVCTPTAGLIISEFRLRGPNGSQDEYIELYNNSDQNITVCTADGSSGWAVVSSDGITKFVLPSGTVVPARSHYLAVGPGYSLAGYAAGDLTYSSDITENSGLGLFNTAYPANFTTGNRFDAVGFTTSNSLYREGSGLSLVGANVGEYGFLRKLNSGVSQDSGDNAADFYFVATNGGVYGSLVAILGPPGPENRFSPIQRNATLPVVVIDPAVAATVAPNRVRDTAAVGPNAAFGTLTMRRTVTNNTGTNITKLRFRIIDITTLNTPGYVAGGAQSDMRVLSSTDSMVTVTGGQSVLVRGTTVETPPNQANGGGLNSSLNLGVVSLSQPLAPGQSINVQFVLGVQQSGSFRFFFNVEALP
ncbi:MAG TPA: Ig-like domain-containing protein [Pyrinomonadaceae bacterium]|nr:Ig-like domain-containing protein [Pyrinomonadaceae bacterium]